MVGAGASLQFLLAGLMTQSFGAYVAVLQAERGWSKTALSGAAALQQMEAAILGPLLGWLIDRFSPQGIIRFGDGAAVLRLMAKVDPARRFDAELELRRRIKEAFDREQIPLPSIPRAVLVRQDGAKEQPA